VPALYTLVYTSNRVSRLFWFGPNELRIEKMRSKFFQKSKSSGLAVTSPPKVGMEVKPV